MFRLIQWFFHWHRWTDWEEISHGRTVRGDYWIEQKRRCTKCKKIQVISDTAWG